MPSKDHFKDAFCHFWSLTLPGHHLVLLFVREQYRHSSKYLHGGKMSHGLKTKQGLVNDDTVFIYDQIVSF